MAQSDRCECDGTIVETVFGRMRCSRCDRPGYADDDGS
jgi:hypothetical protein